MMILTLINQAAEPIFVPYGILVIYLINIYSSKYTGERNAGKNCLHPACRER